jgi:general secretion pathway protein G
MSVRRERGVTARTAFTLMEMLVVVAIIVVLAGAGGVIYMRNLDDAKKSTARSQCKILGQAAASYQLQYGDFPGSLQALTQPTADGGKPYLEASALVDPWGRQYQYAAPGPHHAATGEPDVWSQGPNLADPNGVIGNW